MQPMVEPPGLHDPVIYPPEVYAEDQVESGELRVDRKGSSLLLEHTSVYATVSAGLARVEVTQWFHNPFDEAVDATYLMPLPTGAAVDSLVLRCGGRTLDGFVVDREEARALYEEARGEGRKAALLEQARDNLFRWSVAGICPGEEVEVTLGYTELLPVADGLTTFTFPMTVGPRYSPPWVEDAAGLVTPYADEGRAVDVTVDIAEGLRVGTLFSDTDEVVVEEEGDWGATVALQGELTRPDHDFSLTWALDGEDFVASAVAWQPDPAEDGWIALTVAPPAPATPARAVPRELLYVIDSSCSMAGEPYQVATETVLASLRRMRPSDTFNLVRFGDAATALFDTPQPSSPAAREAAERWLSVFDGGGTNLSQGITWSLGLPGNPRAQRLLLLLTDGFVGDEQDVFRLLRRNLGRASVFALGIGSSPNRHLLEGVAEVGGGGVLYHTPGRPVASVVDRFLDRISRPVLTGLTVEWGELDVYETYPSRLPAVWDGQTLRLVGRFARLDGGTGPLDTMVRVRGWAGDGRYEADLPVRVDPEDTLHEPVALVWARRKIAELERRYGVDGAADEVREVALEYGLVSRQTSLVAVDDQRSACGAASAEIDVPNLLPAGMSAAFAGRRGGLGGGGSVDAVGWLGTRGRGASCRPCGRAYASRDGELATIAGDPVVLGALDKTLVRDVIHRDLNAIRYCYERRLRLDPELAGNVTVRFVIGPDGRVSSATATSELADPLVGECVAERVRRLAFPAPAGGGILKVSFPFLFHPG